MSIEQQAKELARIEPAPRFRLIHAGDLEPRPMDWLARDLIETDSLAAVYGSAASAKTFLSIDIGGCVASGQDFHGRPVQQGPVIYIAGEGFNGIARRLQAWCQVNGVERPELPLYVSNMPAAMTDRENLATVLQVIEATGQRPKLVILDTVARNFGPGDENATKDMSAFVAACDEIRLAHGCAVMLVHHVGHGDQSRARGSSVLNGAIDSAFRVDKDLTGTVTVECTKQKDAPEPEPFAFKFRTVELGFDNDDGTPATSAVLHPADMPKGNIKPQGKNQTAAFEALRKLSDERRQTLTAGGFDPDTARISRADWRQACIDAGMHPPRFHDAETGLQAKGLVNIEGGYVEPC